MTPRSVGRRRVLAGLAAGGALLPAGTARAATPAPTATSTAGGSDLPLRVVLLDVTPSAYSAQDPERSTVVVRVRVENPGSRALTGLTARLVAQRAPSVARSALDDWARAPDRASITRSSASSDDVVVGAGALAPGAGAEVSLSLAAADLGSGAGAHLAAVEVSGDDGKVGVVRTFLVSAPPQVAPTPLTLLLPLVTGRDGSPGGLARDVGGRLGPLVAASSDPRTAWALDPALPAAARDVVAAAEAAAAAASAGQPAGATPGGAVPTGEEARAVGAWLADLSAAAGGRDVVALPHGDPDLLALERSAHGPQLLARAVAAAAGALDDLGATVRTDLAWPADEAADEDVLALARGAGATAVVLDDACLVPDGDLTFTPAGRAEVEVGGSVVEALVADRTMSSVLADCADADQVVLVRQRLIAEAATTTLQRPSDPRPQLLVAPRSFSPVAGAVQALVADVEASGWARWQPLADLLAAPAPAAPWAGPVVPRAAARAALPTAHVAAVEAELTGADGFATALRTPDGRPAPQLLAQQRSALLLLGASWRGHTADLPAARTRVEEALAGLVAGIGIVGGSVRNLAAERSELPVTLVNELDVPVQVDLVLKPRTPRVQLDAVPRQTVAARSQQRVAVPVRALANGGVVVEAQLRTPAGSAVGEPVDIHLNVRADVETWISGVVGGGAAGLLVLGVVRAVRKGRRRVDEAEHADLAAAPREESAPTGQG
ncbi:hypothetical protein FHR75_002182 [Kineococcus radiotolerans]|uniref:Secreted protein n=1 Tax=Kineococcus radiotolerans TaxID=131568 RepID=A0A7W4TLZ9_KINRA|nr:DUF6049 family protein [Kineococcus radiotolerans]MBB2901394.1 hypothetical protein [Kineococcus radiotolerans]